MSLNATKSSLTNEQNDDRIRICVCVCIISKITVLDMKRDEMQVLKNIGGDYIQDEKYRIVCFRKYALLDTVKYENDAEKWQLGQTCKHKYNTQILHKKWVRGLLDEKMHNY